MESRGQKRSETAHELPIEKRPCSSLESQPSASQTSQSQMQPPSSPSKETHESHDSELDTSSSASGSYRSEVEGETNGSSIDSDSGYQASYRAQSSGDPSKFNNVLSSLTGDPEESVQLVALNELCELLAFTTDSSLSGLLADSFAPLLVKLARNDSNPDIMLLAIRAITYFCDVHPRSASYLVRHDAVPALCQRLMAIEYLDVAEQCFQALEKISREQPLACLQSGAIMAVLNYIDFFSTTVQRVALSTVVNVCKKLPSESQSNFMDAVPILCNLLQYEDPQLVESVATCLTRITDRVFVNSKMLDELCKHGLVQQATHLINLNSRTSLSQPVYLGLIALLVKMASGSVVAVRTLFEINISTILKDILSNYDISHGLPLSSMVVGESNQVHEVLKLLNELLPDIVQEQDRPLALEKIAFLTSNPYILQNFALDLLPVLIQVVNSGVNLSVCYGCLSVISKLIHFSKLDTLIELKSSNISSFLAGVFTRKDRHVQILALQIADSILQKHSDSFLNSFIKEGVLFAVDGLLLSSEASNEPINDPAKDGARCLCFAFGMSQSVAGSKILTCKLEKDIVKKLAEHIKCSYFPIESSPEKGLSDIFQKLRTLSASLMDLLKISTNGATSQHEEKFDNLLQQLISVLGGKDPISTFEFIESGIVQSLLNYLSNGQYKDGKGHTKQYDELCIVEKRFVLLWKKLFLYCSNPQLEGSPLRVLIQMLQSALSSVETFPVILNHSTKPRSSHATVPYGRGTPYPSLKVKFKKEEGEEFLNDYSKDTVSVDPFSSLSAIEDHLWSKVRLNETKLANSHISSQEENGNSSPALQACSSPTQDQSLDGYESDSMSIDLPEAMQEEEREECGSSITVGCPGCQNNTSSQKLFFSLNGQQLDPKLTLYQAIIQLQLKLSADNIASSFIWGQVHKVTYRRAVRPAQHAVQCHCHGLDLSSLGRAVPCWQCPSFSSGVFDSGDVGVIGSSCPTHDILSLLKCLECMNRLGFHMISHEKMHAFAKGRRSDKKMDIWDVVAVGGVSQNEFVNIRLTEKLEQQLRDPLAVSVGGIPYWCSQLMTFCPFLFGFEARCKYFRLAALDQSPRLNNDGVTTNAGRNGSSPRKKILVHRNRILDSATEMMRLYTSSHRGTTLEVEYNEEVGTGLGPTLEFYTLVSHEFQKIGLGLWREDHTDVSSIMKGVESEDYRTLEAPLGLFPRPWSLKGKPNGGAEFLEISKMFGLLGQFVAKALLDRRVLDIPFSKSFYKIILGKELSVYDIQSFDLELGRVLLEFICLIEKKRYLEGGVAGEKSLNGHDDLCFQGSKIEDLFVEYILPGYPDYNVDSSSESKTVNMSNLEEYVLFVIDATIKTGISRQIEAFKSGFDEVFPIKHLQVFTEEELEHLLRGEHDIWNTDELLNHIKFDHGYTASSLSALHLLEIIREFNREEQKLFLRFVTGAPSLPSGGLAALNPKLTIVRKVCSDGVDADLPSVMTCANYLKLPAYSTKERMKEKLMYAITEGQGSFHLS